MELVPAQSGRLGFIQMKIETLTERGDIDVGYAIRDRPPKRRSGLQEEMFLENTSMS